MRRAKRKTKRRRRIKYPPLVKVFNSKPLSAIEKSFKRRISSKFQAAIDGIKLCLVCDCKLQSRQRYYCSAKCRLMNTPSMIAKVVRTRDGWRCALCSAQLTRRDSNHEVDHIIPVVMGGGIGCGLENYRLLCKSCHKSVKPKLTREFRIQKKKILLYEQMKRVLA